MSIWTNTFVNLDKYIFQLGQMHLAIWTNTIRNLEVHLSIWRNTFSTLDISHYRIMVSLEQAMIANLPSRKQEDVTKGIKCVKISLNTNH